MPVHLGSIVAGHRHIALHAQVGTAAQDPVIRYPVLWDTGVILGHQSVLHAPVGTTARVALTRYPVLWGTGVAVKQQPAHNVYQGHTTTILAPAAAPCVIATTTVQVCLHSNHWCQGMCP